MGERPLFVARRVHSPMINTMETRPEDKDNDSGSW
jgi:hypothetical protein